MKTIGAKSGPHASFAWWELAGHAIRKSLSGGIALPAAERSFTLLCDLDTAFDRLSTAMDKWHAALEKGRFEADNADVLAALDGIQTILDELNGQGAAGQG